MLPRRPARLAAVLLAVPALALVSCQTGMAGAARPADHLVTVSPTTVTPSPSPTTTPVPTTTRPPTPTRPTTKAPALPAGHGQVIVLDPGHNGGNASHPSEINALVPAGRGQRKACNTTGTATNAGYAEHAFNWSVALRVRSDLVAKGYRVVMTRSSDTGVGPCVNVRAQVGNDADAAAVVSIHADGSTSSGAHGFHVEYSSPPLNSAQSGPSVTLATTLRDTVRSHGFTTANYIGHDGLFGRADLGGLNLSDRPTALIECGNMRDAGDAAVLSSASGRERIADAIAAGIVAYVAHAG
ncbi:MAG TPA: N-acetylmuramoyl-L-alanine amidase [Pseudonocardiaceae bacterium]|nr:N-acetylmuramoyl-L-alanine amidase [Pseudonocardiaceae bacterium]